MQHWCRLRWLTNELLSSLWPWPFPRRGVLKLVDETGDPKTATETIEAAIGCGASPQVPTFDRCHFHVFPWRYGCGYQGNRFGSWGAFQSSRTFATISGAILRSFWQLGVSDSIDAVTPSKVLPLLKEPGFVGCTEELPRVHRQWKAWIFLFHWLICRCHAKGKELQSFLVCALVRLENEDGKGFYNSVWRCPKFINI